VSPHRAARLFWSITGEEPFVLADSMKLPQEINGYEQMRPVRASSGSKSSPQKRAMGGTLVVKATPS
jgi:hypothetical protein